MKTNKIIGLIFALGLFLSGNASAQKAELYVQTGHSAEINNLSLSADGKLLASSADDGTAKIWDAVSRTELRTFDGGFEAVKVEVALNRKGLMLATLNENVIKIWDVESATELAKFTYLSKVTIREEGKSWVSNHLNSVEFSPDGKLLAATATDGTIILWDIEQKKQIKNLVGHTKWAYKAVFSPNGKMLATSSADKTIILWDVETGKKLRILKGHTAFVFGIAFNYDGSLLASGSDDKTAKLWNVTDGKELKTFVGHEKAVGEVSFLHNQNTLISSSEDRTLKLWNIETGATLKTLSGLSGSISSFVISPDNQTIMSGSFDNIQIMFWNIESGKSEPLYKFSYDVSRIEFSPDFSKLAIVYLNQIKIWDLVEGKQIGINFAQSGYFSPAAFSPDGTKFAAAGNDDVKIWDVSSGKEIKTFIHPAEVTNLQFNADGSFFVGQTYTKSDQLFYTVWDTATGAKMAETSDFSEIRKIIPKYNVGDLGKVQSVFNGGKLRAEVKNSIVVFYDNQTNRELCKLIQLPTENDWVVITPDGLFDGTTKAWKDLFWRLDNNTFNYAPVEAFFKEFYYPGLLQEIMVGKIPTLPEKDLSQVDIRQPNLKIIEIDGKLTNSSTGISANKSTIKVKVEITDNANKGRKTDFPVSSGAQDLRLFRNGSLVKLWEKNVFELGEKDGCQQIAATKDSLRKVVCETGVQIMAGKNEFAAYAFNHDNVKSTDATAEVVGADSLKRKGKLQILSIGVNEYQNRSYNLKYAVPDAVDFGTELRKQQINLANYDAPEVVQITDKEATKQNILYALERFAKGEKALKPQNISAEIEAKLSKVEKTQPEDVLVIYFAGHGTASKDRFFLIPTDGFPTNYKLEKSLVEKLQQQSVSDLELETVLRDLDAGQILLVVDACNSGQALEAEEKRRGPMNSRGLAQLAFEKGMYILTAAQSYQAALEVSRTPQGKKIEHGLLTYSLLDGLTNAKADSDSNKSITEREWFSFAIGEVPRMQLEEMQRRSAEIKGEESNVKGRSDIVFLDGDNPNLDPEKRRVQTPRVFYRREIAINPLIVAKP